MAEARVFSCDNEACESKVMLVQTSAFLSELGWWTVFGPRGTKPIHTCSSLCLALALVQRGELTDKTLSA